jgi:urease accessory protein
MTAEALPSGAAEDLPPALRVDARLALAVGARGGVRGGASAILDRHEAGALRFRFPRPLGPLPEAVIVNVAGGLAGGDRVAIAARIEADAGLALTSAAAERIYRSAGAETRITAELAVEAGACALWLPQETILQDGARLERRFTIDLAPDATLLLAEMLVFGRRAAGEAYLSGSLRESWRLRRARALILADETRIEGDFAAHLLRPGALDSHVALATLLFARPAAGDDLDAIRAAIPREAGFEGGASDLGGLVLMRLACHDAARLRVATLDLARLLARRVGADLPRSLAL